MKEIKFRLRFEKEDGTSYFEFLTFEQINEDGRSDILSKDVYTGLKDKNGVEIYEGDIIHNKGVLMGMVSFGEYRCKDQTNNDRQKSHVGWFIKHKYWVSTIDEIKHYSHEYLSLEDLFWNVQASNYAIVKNNDNNYVEVVGNIYENPELLGDEE